MRNYPPNIDTQVEHGPRHNTNQREPIIELLFRNKMIWLELGIHDWQDYMAAADYQWADFVKCCEYYGDFALQMGQGDQDDGKDQEEDDDIFEAVDLGRESWWNQRVLVCLGDLGEEVA